MASLYIHIPFCQKKCFYCSFVVSVGQEARIDHYLDCLELEARKFSGTQVETIYIGGGTPTFLNNVQLRKLLGIIKTHFIYSPQSEFTIEANPEGMDFDKAKLLFDLGVNRISLGVQSLKDTYLKFLGRCHEVKTVYTAFVHLRKAGFKNINLDLMFSFPDQTLKEIKEDVLKLLNLRSEHISLYALTIEQPSRFFVEGVKLKNSEIQKKQYLWIAKILEKNQYVQYEISNFAKEGKESKHNINYWSGGDYIGLGVGAHSHHDGLRSWNVARLQEYLRRMTAHFDPQEGQEQLTPQERYMEKLLFGLRMNQGVDLKRLEREFDWILLEEKIIRLKSFCQEGFLIWEDSHLKTTPKGRVVLDELCSRLI